MSGYTPVFSEIYLGTLYGRWPAAPLWASLLPLCDKDGTIDMSPQAISGLTGWPMDLLMEGIRQLSEPDQHSRTSDHEGRRLIPLDESRPWGWKVVNHGKYREKARLMAKNVREVESGVNAERMADRRRPPETAADPLSDSYTNTDTEGAKAPTVRGSKRCPEGFIPDRAYALKEIPDLDYEREAQKFKDWEFKTARKDWPACWRTWIGNARDRKQYAKRTNGINPREWT